MNNYFSIAGGRIHCLQCQAKSKRTGVQCRAPAMRGKRVCRFHGALSSGPKTAQGRAACAKAKTIHGQVSRATKEEGKKKLAEFKVIG